MRAATASSDDEHRQVNPSDDERERRQVDPSDVQLPDGSSTSSSSDSENELCLSPATSETDDGGN